MIGRIIVATSIVGFGAFAYENQSFFDMIIDDTLVVLKQSPVSPHERHNDVRFETGAPVYSEDQRKIGAVRAIIHKDDKVKEVFIGTSPYPAELLQIVDNKIVLKRTGADKELSASADNPVISDT